jgi:DNA-binding GntR family transcriptional regulator
VEALDRVQGQIRVAMTTTSAAPGRMEMAFADHERIFGALAARDAEAAERAGRDHVSRLRRTLWMLRDGDA